MPLGFTCTALPPWSGDTPAAVSPDSTPGVYEVEGATFPTAGPWAVEMAARVDGVGVVHGSATVEVVSDAVVPAPGDRAPRDRQRVIGDRGVSDDHIDSRALDGKPIPDPSLHQRSIAEAIERSDQPWCSSPPPPTARVAFCGPMTDMIEDLSRTYGCRAEIEDRINAL